MAAARSSSLPPERRIARRSVSRTANKQFRNWPSAVRRTRSQVPQNGCVTLLITPISPLPSRYRHTDAGAVPRCTASSGYTASMVATTSDPGTTTCGPDGRFGPGEADSVEPVPHHADAGDALDLLEGQDVVAGGPPHPFLGHAVLAPEVAPVGDGDAQIAHCPAVRVDEFTGHDDPD